MTDDKEEENEDKSKTDDEELDSSTVQSLEIIAENTHWLQESVTNPQLQSSKVHAFILNFPTIDTWLADMKAQMTKY